MAYFLKKKYQLKKQLLFGSSFAFQIDDLKQVFGGSVKILSR